MPSTSKPVAPLDKVTLRIRAIPRNQTDSSKNDTSELSFICGIGSAGLVPFEQMLCNKSVDERFSLPVEPGTGDALFGHLNCVLSQTIEFTAPCDLDITIAAVAVAQGHEVVKAMAQMSEGCGGGCDCGCGC